MLYGSFVQTFRSVLRTAVLLNCYYIYPGLHLRETSYSASDPDTVCADHITAYQSGS